VRGLCAHPGFSCRTLRASVPRKRGRIRRDQKASPSQGVDGREDFEIRMDDRLGLCGRWGSCLSCSTDNDLFQGGFEVLRWPVRQVVELPCSGKDYHTSPPYRGCI